MMQRLAQLIAKYGAWWVFGFLAEDIFGFADDEGDGIDAQGGLVPSDPPAPGDFITHRVSAGEFMFFPGMFKAKSMEAALMGYVPSPPPPPPQILRCPYCRTVRNDDTTCRGCGFSG